MNSEELKEALSIQGKRTRDASLRARTAKTALDKFDAESRCAIKKGGIPEGWSKAPTDDDTKALALLAKGREQLAQVNDEMQAENDGIEAETKCLVAHASVVCAETAAMSRISG